MESKIILKYKNKTTSQLRIIAGNWFRKFIRLRDTDENGWGTCISSSQRLKYGNPNCQAGHYYAAGSFPNMEFNENNVHLQGKSDNYFKAANLIEYQRNLIKKIGLDNFNDLENLEFNYKRFGYKHNRFFLIEKIEEYKEKVKKLAQTKNFEV